MMMKRQYDKVRYRYYYYLRPIISNHAKKMNKSFERSTLDLVKALETGREYELEKLRDWDLEMDLKLMR